MLRADGEFWSEAHDALLIERYAAGVRARAIAAELTAAGFPVTRNGILGRVFRLRRAGKMAPLKRAPVALARTPRPIRPGETAPKDVCRWPIGHPGEGGFHFCEAPEVVPGRPYCVEHCRIAYRKPGEDDAPKRGPVVDRGWAGSPVKVRA